jgi:hypothetical protein
MEMGMSNYVMDCEEQFMDEATAVIGECDDVNDLLQTMEENGHLRLLEHFSDGEKCELVDEIWNDFWSAKGE